MSLERSLCDRKGTGRLSKRRLAAVTSFFFVSKNSRSRKGTCVCVSESTFTKSPYFPGTKGGNQNPGCRVSVAGPSQREPLKFGVNCPGNKW